MRPKGFHSPHPTQTGYSGLGGSTTQWPEEGQWEPSCHSDEEREKAEEAEHKAPGRRWGALVAIHNR